MRARCLMLVTLTGLLTTPAHAAETRRVLTNHIGYETDGPKRAVVQLTDGDELSACTIRDAASDRAVLEIVPVRAGRVDRWRDWAFWTIDFDELRTPGSYIVECVMPDRRLRSFPFAIADDLLESHTISDVIAYFKGQRSDGVKDKADRAVRFEGLQGATIDARGGWYDATGDYGKHLSHLSFSTYFNPQQLPLVPWSLLTSRELLVARADRNFRQYERRMLDEAMVGADYLVRVHRPGGSFYRSVSAPGFEKAPSDRVVAPAMTGFRIKRTQTDTGDHAAIAEPGGADLREYEVGYRAGGGVSIAALAMASTAPVSGDYVSADYLRVAEEAFAYLEQHNLLYTNDGRENIVDDYCALLAATELYRATGKPAYREAAAARARSLGSRLTSWQSHRDYWRADDADRPFFHPADAGLPVVALLGWADIAGEPDRQLALAAVRRSLEHELAITAEVANPFGYPRQLVQGTDGRRRPAFFFPHDTETGEWWQGENARLGSLAFAARLAARRFADDPRFVGRLRAYSQRSLDWILGLNPFDACMLDGSGRNNPWYLFFGFWEYTNSPGGICNGITAGMADELGIDFQLPYEATGGDHDWRWGEQWLPHASWYLAAVAAR
ncbi:MAG TPA: glycoside hydrolase family 9 protein [Thermoanaerobaculales bacterium]|nr:glycoside hydrolase family 9 protein [Thermoanaerobaculales bacterium]HQP42952.1 glycoside hydrolase family 9 protein [Thermoanaerobaculales bacterium]